MKVLTSFPVPASISRNMSTRARTSFAALALLTKPRNGRENFIKPASSETYTILLPLTVNIKSLLLKNKNRIVTYSYQCQCLSKCTLKIMSPPSTLDVGHEYQFSLQSFIDCGSSLLPKHCGTDQPSSCMVNCSYFLCRSKTATNI